MNEMREEVGRLISSFLGSREGEVDARVAEAVGHLEEGEGLEKVREVFAKDREHKPWYKKGWMLFLWALLLMVGIWFWSVVSVADTTSSANFGIHKILNSTGGITLKHDTYQFTEEEKWVLNGDPSKKTPVERAYGLWQSDPPNKQYAAEAMHEYNNWHDQFPDDLLDVGAEVDPGNPWYLYMRSTNLVDLALSKRVQKTRRVEANDGYEVIDQAKLDEAWLLLERADGMGKLKQHRIDLFEKRLVILSKNREHDYFSKIAFISEAAGFQTGGMEYLKISKLFTKKFKLLSDQSESGDKVEVKKWIGILTHFLSKILDDRCSLVDILVVQSYLEGVLPEAQLAAENVGLTKEAEKISRLVEQLKEEKLIKSELRKKIDSLGYGEYGLIGGMMGPTGHGPLMQMKFDPRDYDCDRYSEHSFITKYLAAIAGMILFIMLLFTASYLLYKGRMARFLGGRMLSIFATIDWVMIIFCGVILPVIFYYIINQHSALGVRKWNIGAVKGNAVLVQFGSMLLLVLVMSYASLRWRLYVKSHGVVRRNGIWIYLSVACSLGAMLLIGCAGYKVNWITYIAYACLVFSAGFVFVRGLKGLINNEQLFATSALNRGMIPLIALTTIVMMLMVSFYYADEKKWIREDPLMTLRPDHLGEDTSSYKIKQAMKQELKDRLEMIR